jgi:hypothetical membrane protein
VFSWLKSFIVDIECEVIMVDWLRDLAVFRITGFIVVLITLIGVILPMVVYRGREGERYSILNHFISELGERGISRWARIFNLSMILSGLGVILCALSLGLGLPGLWAKLGMLFGVVTGVGLMMVGFFPMDDIKPHATAAVTFFRGGLLMVLAFSLAILFPPQNEVIIPRLYGLVGLIPVAAFSTFLILLWNDRDHVDQTLSAEGVQHPRVSKFTISEWAVYFSIILWVLVLSLGIS